MHTDTHICACTHHTYAYAYPCRHNHTCMHHTCTHIYTHLYTHAHTLNHIHIIHSTHTHAHITHTHHSPLGPRPASAGNAGERRLCPGGVPSVRWGGLSVCWGAPCVCLAPGLGGACCRTPPALTALCFCSRHSWVAARTHHGPWHQEGALHEEWAGDCCLQKQEGLVALTRAEGAEPENFARTSPGQREQNRRTWPGPGCSLFFCVFQVQVERLSRSSAYFFYPLQDPFNVF